MSTTTIRLPEELKARVAELAKHSGMTTHGYILEAITEKTQQETLRRDFDALADTSLAAIAATGKTIPWSKLRSQLEKRITEKTAKRGPASKAAR